VRRALALAAVLVLAGCGSARHAAKTPAPAAAQRPSASAVDVGFARAMLARARDDAQIDQLASRKGSTDAVRSGAAHRFDRDEAAIGGLTRFLRSAHVAVPPQPLSNPPGWNALVVVSGYRFDDAYAPLARARAAADAALARRELRNGSSPAAKRIARTIAAG
jgi:hypothetical protein